MTTAHSLREKASASIDYRGRNLIGKNFDGMDLTIIPQNSPASKAVGSS